MFRVGCSVTSLERRLGGYGCIFSEASGQLATSLALFVAVKNAETNANEIYLILSSSLIAIEVPRQRDTAQAAEAFRLIQTRVLRPPLIFNSVIRT